MKKKENPLAETPYNPLAKENLGISVADAMLIKPPSSLPPDKSFLGAGIYAIYYVGPFAAYEAIATKNRNKKFGVPIYVGKAIPEGARKGGSRLLGTDLYDRLREHAKSIEQTKNLKLADFFCRYLVVDDIWIPLGESLLIEKFSPVWNKLVDGFGNHDPGSGRYNQQNSLWDTIHPGRSWAVKLQPCTKSESQILEMIRKYLAALSNS